MRLDERGKVQWDLKFAYYGDPKLKKSMIKSMEEHIRKDEIIKGRSYFSIIESGEPLKGCAVSCIAYEDLKIGLEDFKRAGAFFQPSGGNNIHRRVNQLLNIDNIGVFADIFHELDSSKKVANFSLELLKLLKVEIDYTYLIDSYISDMEYQANANLAKSMSHLNPSLEGPRDIYGAIISRRLDYHTQDRFLEHVKAYNKRYKKVSKAVKYGVKRNSTRGQ